MKYRFDKQLRIKKRDDLDRVFSRGQRINDRYLTVFAVQNGLTFSRGGVAVSKRHGGAVRRNRLKRLCREAIRHVLPDLPEGWDVMVIPRAGRNLRAERLEESLRRLSGRVTQQDANRSES
ncbi:MAG: ribonuclease P protein component [Phycisphaerae bacterium]